MRLPRKLINYGSSAVLLEWEQQIDPNINQSVHAYAAKVSEHPAVVEAVPAYNSMLVTYDPRQINAFSLKEWIFDLEVESTNATEGRKHQFPVVYGGDFGPDLEEVALKLKMTSKRVVKLHSSVEYRVYQMGYQPGFAFLGLTDKKLDIPRKDTPRPMVPAGSVGLAGRQTGIYPHDAPGGWQIIGRCPVKLWRSDEEPNARLQSGDVVSFYPMAANDWEFEKEKGNTWPQ